MADTPYFKSDDPLDHPPARGRNYTLLFFMLVGFALIVLVIISQPSRRDDKVGARHPSVGKAPETWQLEPLTGDPAPIDLAALTGRVTLVNFWGTWCPPCQEELPHIVKLAKELVGNDNFHLAAVSCEPGIEKDIDKLRTTTQQFLADANFKLATYYDPQAKSRLALMSTTGEDLAFPTTVVFDRQGTVRGYWRGYFPGSERDIEALVRSLLAEKS